MSETGNSKVDVIGRIPQGTHLCQFYHDKEELGEALAPYFVAGLSNNDMCIWITAESLKIEEAKKALEQSMPDSQDSFESGQMQIFDASDWFPPSGKFDADKQLSAWKEKLGEAKLKGYTGIRAAIDHSWLDSQDMEVFSQYESITNDIISQYPMTAICCYPADHCTPSQYIEIFKNHGFLLSRENSEWKLIENQERSQLEKKIHKSEEKYRLMAENVTDVIWTMDMNLNFTYMSPSVFRARGFTTEEAMSMPIHEYLTPSSYQASMEVFAEEIENEKNPSIDPLRSQTLELETYCKDGSIIWTEAVMRFLRNDAGDPVGILGVTRNITERKQVEAALRESEEKYRFLAENISDLIAMTDPEGNYVYVNEAHKEVVGYHSEELLGEKASKFIHPDDRRPLVEAFTKAEGKESVADFRYKCKDGSYKWLHSQGHLIFDTNGILEGTIVVASDITERKQAEEVLKQSEERFRALVEDSFEGIAVIEPDGNVQYKSPSNDPLLGYQVDELTNENMFETIHPEDEPRLIEDFTHLINKPGEIFTGTYRTLHKDGTWHFLEATAKNLLDDPHINGLVVNFRDITDRKKKEEQLQLYTDELNEAYSEVFQYAEVVAHDICAPLRAVRFYTHMLRSDIPEGPNNECQSHLDTIDLAVNEGESMARELFVLAGIGKGEMNYQKVDIGALLREQIKLAGLDEKGIVVRMRKKWPIINSEPVLIRQIFTNLIGNAIKFNDSSTKKIELGWKLTEDKEYEFFVRDNGIGIPPYKEANIFRVFGKLHPTVEYEGSGMGLAIVKKAAGKLGGSVRFTSEVGKGSTFFVTIPEGKM